MTNSIAVYNVISRRIGQAALPMLLFLTLGMLALSFGCTEQQADDVAAIDAPRSQPTAYTQAYVQAAIDYYEANGLDETVNHYNDPASVDGQWYIFIADETGRLIVHGANHDLVGVPLDDVIDGNGYPSGRIVANDADEGGAWSEYVFFNPATGRSQAKHSWLVIHDGLIFGSGWYEDGPRKSEQPAYTQEYVRQALNLYDSLGREALVDYYNNPVSIDGQWYMFITDESGRLIVNGANQDLVGMPLVDVVGANGFPSGRIVADDADEDGEWSVNTFYNPATGRSQIKHPWLVRHDGLIFASGWYEDGPRKSEQPAYTQALVQQAMNLYDSSGLDVAIEYYSDPVSVDGPWYVGIIDAETGRTIAHFNPDVRDRDPALRVDSTGYFYGDDLLRATEEGHWFEVVFHNPATGQEERKHSWAVLHDGYIFSSGWYE